MTERRYKAYMLTVLATVFCFNNIDRIAISLFLQDIKTDLHLSDTQLGLMTGIAFAAFYSIMGIPIARWADRGNRITIVGVTTALWSVALIACGGAKSFFQLLLLRVFVAVGEAGCTPVAHSLIADYFSRADRPRAVARFLLGGSASVLIGYFVAGWLNEIVGWRLAFALLGLPGIPLAALAWLTLREPRKGALNVPLGNANGSDGPSSSPAAPQMRCVLRTMWRVQTFRHLLAGNSVLLFFFYGISKWQPTFFIRSYGMSVREVGAWFGAVIGGAMLLGTLLSGEWPARFAPQNERRQLIVLGIVFIALVPLSAATYLSTKYNIAFLFMGINALLMSATFGPLYSTIPMIVPSNMRAIAIAIVYLFGNLIGMGLGPLVVGVISDALHTTYGEDSLRYALVMMTPGYVWGAWHFLRASRYVAGDIDCAARIEAALYETGSALTGHPSSFGAVQSELAYDGGLERSPSAHN